MSELTEQETTDFRQKCGIAARCRCIDTDVAFVQDVARDQPTGNERHNGPSAARQCTFIGACSFFVAIPNDCGAVQRQQCLSRQVAFWNHWNTAKDRCGIGL